MQTKSSTIIFFIIIIFLCSCILANEAFAVDETSIMQIVNKFNEESSRWYSKFKVVATDLLYMVITFQICRTSINAALQSTNTQEYLGQIIWVFLLGMVFLLIIENYQDWTRMVVNGLNNIAVSAVGNINFNPDKPFLAGLEITKIINNTAKDMSWEKTAIVIVMYISAFIIMIIFSLITARTIVIKCELFIGVTASVILIPLGASDLFRGKAINAIEYAVAVGFKIFTLTLICGIGFTLFQNFQFNDDNHIETCLILIGVSMVLLSVTFTLPETVSSLVSHANGTAGGMLQAFNTVANTVTAAAAVAGTAYNMAKGGIGGAARGIDNVVSSKNLAKESLMGKGADDKWTDASKWQNLGKFGQAKETFRNFNASRQQAKINHSTIAQEAKNNINLIRQARG
jgi:type IV secretion system protein TrbL